MIACTDLLAKYVLTTTRMNRKSEVEEYRDEEGRSWDCEAVMLSLKALLRLVGTDSTGTPTGTPSQSQSQALFLKIGGRQTSTV